MQKHLKSEQLDDVDGLPICVGMMCETFIHLHITYIQPRYNLHTTYNHVITVSSHAIVKLVIFTTKTNLVTYYLHLQIDNNFFLGGGRGGEVQNILKG